MSFVQPISIANIISGIRRIGIRAAPAAGTTALHQAEEAVSFIMYAIIAAVAVGIGLMILNSLGQANPNLENVTQATTNTVATYFNTFIVVLVLGGIVAVAGLILRKLMEAFRAR